MTEAFSTSLSRISQRKHFRSGALYSSVWETCRGELFSKNKLIYPKVKLRKLIATYNAIILKKGILDREYVLIDLDDIESCRGRIKEEPHRKVSKIGSDRIIFGDADILYSKLRPYLCKVIINDKSQMYIGTAELVPFKVKQSIADYVKYLLMTKDAIDIVTSLMYGKNHPRVDVEDLLNVKVPYPPLEKQAEIVKIIDTQVEQEVVNRKAKLVSLQKAIDDVFKKERVNTELTPEKLTIYQSSFKATGQQKHVRCGARYRFFWDVRLGKLFSTSAYNAKRLGSLVLACESKIMKKGTLDGDYQLVEITDIATREGRIINNLRTVNEIGSDKVLFEDADLLYSQINPFLGHVILNDKTKPYIGTTELIPLKAKTGVDPRYIRYLLLSSAFLYASHYLMYGNVKFRINLTDMLNIKVPCPKLDIQEKIANEIWEVEKQNITLNDEIDTLYKRIDHLLLSQFTLK